MTTILRAVPKGTAGKVRYISSTRPFIPVGYLGTSATGDPMMLPLDGGQITDSSLEAKTIEAYACLSMGNGLALNRKMFFAANTTITIPAGYASLIIVVAEYTE